MKTSTTRQLSALLFTVGVLIPCASYAEYFGVPIGRTVEFSNQPELSVEGAYLTGKIKKASYQHTGARLNYKLSPNVLLFGDLGQSKVESAGDTTFGMGMYYGLDRSVTGNLNAAVKVSFHQANLVRRGNIRSKAHDVDGAIGCMQYFNSDLFWVTIPGSCSTTTGGSGGAGASSGASEIRNLALEVMFSGDLPDSSLKQSVQWYANGGVQLLSGDSDNSVFGVGMGMVVPLDSSEAYAGIDYADGFVLGFGLRYFVR